METAQTDPLIDRPETTHADHVDDTVLQISDAGHWFLEGWIGDHLVEFLVGALGCTSRTLRGANGTGIGVSGCSHCVVSFMGLQTEFPILVGDLASGTDAIIGTDVLDQCCHTLWTSRMAYCLQTGCLAAVASEGYQSFRLCLHIWPLLSSTLFRGCTPLYCTYYWRSSYAL